jgi:hypothetical protein
MFLTLLAVLLSPMAANAIPITTSVGGYDVTTIDGIYADVFDLLKEQVWWGNGNLAAEFSDLVGISLGFPNNGNLGPFYLVGEVYGKVWCSANLCSSEGTTNFSSWDGNPNSYTWAVANKVPEPGTLALFAIGLFGMGLARRKKA